MYFFIEPPKKLLSTCFDTKKLISLRFKIEKKVSISCMVVCMNNFNFILINVISYVKNMSEKLNL